MLLTPCSGHYTSFSPSASFAAPWIFLFYFNAKPRQSFIHRTTSRKSTPSFQITNVIPSLMTPQPKTKTLSTNCYKSVIKLSTKTDQVPCSNIPNPTNTQCSIKAVQTQQPHKTFCQQQKCSPYKVAKKLNAILTHNLHFDKQYIANNAVIKLKNQTQSQNSNLEYKRPLCQHPHK